MKIPIATVRDNRIRIFRGEIFIVDMDNLKYDRCPHCDYETVDGYCDHCKADWNNEKVCNIVDNIIRRQQEKLLDISFSDLEVDNYYWYRDSDDNNSEPDILKCAIYRKKIVVYLSDDDRTRIYKHDWENNHNYIILAKVDLPK